MGYVAALRQQKTERQEFWLRQQLQDANRELEGEVARRVALQVELERQAADLKIKPGDKIKVIFMGKQQTTVPGSTRPSYKNLYQLTRMEGT